MGVPVPRVAGPGQGAAPGAFRPDAGPRLRRRFCCSRARDPLCSCRDSADVQRWRGRWPPRGGGSRRLEGRSPDRRGERAVGAALALGRPRPGGVSVLLRKEPFNGGENPPGQLRRSVMGWTRE